MASARVRSDVLALACAGALLGALVALVLVLAAGARAADRGALEAKLNAGREEASALAAELQASQAELASAEAEAAQAEKHEERLSALLAEGEEREAQLSEEVAATRHRLAIEKARLRRSRGALAQRLVDIYETGVPDTTSIILGSGDFEELVTRDTYLRAINESDTALARRVGETRDAVHHQVVLVAAARRQAVAYDERVAAARDQIAAVREAAAASAARLAEVSGAREASLAQLKGDIAKWVDDVKKIRAEEARERREAEASEAEANAGAEEEVGRWLGGPYSIPTYIVMCESGGNYSAVNPSSGAGGAYQILPSTWELYGGQGEPQNAPKAEQDRIAAEIWADSGSSAWVCGSL
ncbi:MAG TPA: transglycosylase family protein [Solirubrobacterales bacterium]|nr:transglycosylase family protein [Solirubrobacterales bacterium]